MESIDNISKIQVEKIIIKIDIFFDNCDYTKNDIQNILTNIILKCKPDYKPRYKMIIHYIISKILTKKIIHDKESKIICNIIDLLNDINDNIKNITFIYIVDKIFLYNVITPEKKSILIKLSENDIIKNYINLYDYIASKASVSIASTLQDSTLQDSTLSKTASSKSKVPQRSNTRHMVISTKRKLNRSIAGS